MENFFFVITIMRKNIAFFFFFALNLEKNPKPTMLMKKNAGGMKIIGYTFEKILVYVAFIRIFSLQEVLLLYLNE